MWIDPIVEEVHQIRKQIAAEHGNNLRDIAAHILEKQKAHADKLVSYPAKDLLAG